MHFLVLGNLEDKVIEEVPAMEWIGLVRKRKWNEHFLSFHSMDFSCLQQWICLYNWISSYSLSLWLRYYVLGNILPIKQSELLGGQEQGRPFLSNICSIHGHEFESWTSENTWWESISIIGLWTSHISMSRSHHWENFTTKPFLLASFLTPG